MSEVDFSTVPAQLREPMQGTFKTTQDARDRIANEHEPLERDYAPRRRDRPKSVILTEPEPPKPQESLSANAARVATMVDDLQKDRDQLARRLSDALARIEQFEGKVADMQSLLETERLNVSVANQKAEDARSETIRLQAIMENVGGLIADGLQKA